MILEFKVTQYNQHIMHKQRFGISSVKRAQQLGALVILLNIFSCSAALAAADEIQVYTEELNDPGQYGVELHVNYAIEGAKQPGYTGESPAHHMSQVTPEFSYGINKNWEAGMYVPVAREESGQLNENGLRLRMKYIATPVADSPMFWGMNVEAGYSDRRVAENSWGMELRPIIGYRTDHWLASFNPIVNTDLVSNARPAFEPALKMSRKVVQDLHLGFEYYGNYGEVSNMLPASERTHYLFAALDYESKNFGMNFGIGRGDSNAPDNLIVKAIFALPLM